LIFTFQSVLIVSPQHWGTMHVTKHHYAIELAKLGYNVYFLEPVDANWNWPKSSFKIINTEIPSLRIIKQSVNIPYNLKFHFKLIYDWFIKTHIYNLEREIGAFDLIWSFDLSNAFPLKYFSNKSKKIFFAADWPNSKVSINAAQSADLIVSVAPEILDEFSSINCKKILVDHAVADCFIEEGKMKFIKKDKQIRIGLSGNFLRSDIDRQALLDIIYSFSNINFEFFGSYQFNENNLGGINNEDTHSFILALLNATNVSLHGMIKPEELAKELRRMDAFMICYDVLKDQSKGTNYHKMMEYLCYSRPIISNYVSRYKDNPMVYMCSDKSSNKEIKSLLNKMISDLSMDSNQLILNNQIVVKKYSFMLNHILGNV
jgi:hypothetical protein